MKHKGLFNYKLWICVIISMIIGSQLQVMANWAVKFYFPNKECVVEPIYLIKLCE